MFSIGEFARLGQVSVRMLRHYDAIGLLPPAAVEPSSGYRAYHADQLGRLNRIIALKDLGFSLQQVQLMLDDRIAAAELRGMLRLRRAQLEAQLTADAHRMAGIEARLRMIEKEGAMPTEEVVLKSVAPVRVAELTAIAASYGPADIGPVISPLYPELFRRLDAAGIRPADGPAIAYYEDPAESGDAIIVHAAMPVAAPPQAAHNFKVVDLPAIGAAATIIHRGPMDDVMQSLHALARWIEDHGYRPAGYHREVYLDYYPDEPAKGVTELQVTVAVR